MGKSAAKVRIIIRSHARVRIHLMIINNLYQILDPKGPLHGILLVTLRPICEKSTEMMFDYKKLYPWGLGAFVVAIVGTLLFFIFAPASKMSESQYLYIDEDDSVDSIAMKLDKICHSYGTAGIMTLARHTDYSSHIRTGCYEISPSEGAFFIYRHLRNGQQSPVRLTIPSVRTADKLAEVLDDKLMYGKEKWMEWFTSNDSLSIVNTDTTHLACLFIPNTYEVYWNTTPKKLLQKMSEERKAFWNGERAGKANALGMSQDEVITLASIIDEETANDAEKPMIAGMYYNRLKQNMPLQADPTVKYAIGDFSLKRIYNNMLRTKSPYNTYINTGLPPGPIRIPTVAGIDAVLNMVHHDYLYMCAKADFSGTHTFARTYQEHLTNAAKYTAALNAREIK